MTDWKLPWRGACRCGRIELTITEPPIVTMACHCSGCQRMTASAFSLSILVPTTGFSFTGEPVIGGIHGPDKHFHCEYCKSWLFTRINGLDIYTNVRATMLDDHGWYAPFVETCTSEKLPWATTGAKHSFPNIPSPDVWGPIVAEFAATTHR